MSQQILWTLGKQEQSVLYIWPQCTAPHLEKLSITAQTTQAQWWRADGLGLFRSHRTWAVIETTMSSSVS